MKIASRSIDLISKKKQNKTKKVKNRSARAAQIFCVVLHDYNAVLYDKNVKLPICALFLRRNCRMCSPKILFPVFMFAFIFFLPLIFTLLAVNISHFLTVAMKASCFSSSEIRLLCFQSFALALSL